MTNTALLIIDVQDELFHKSTKVYNAGGFLANLNRLAAQAQQAGAPVIYVQHSSKTILVEGTPGWQLHPQLHPLPGDLILHKHHPSAFEDTHLKEELEQRGVDTVVITGMVTHGCVQATTQDALKRGYRTVLVGDAHSHYNKLGAQLVEEWNAKLAALGVQVVNTAEVEFK